MSKEGCFHMNILKKGCLGVFALAVMCLSMSAAKADQVFVLTGNNGVGNPYNVTATITQSGSQLTLTLTNNLAGQNDVGQSISGFQFHIAGFSGTGFSGFSGTGREGNFNGATNEWDDVGGSSSADALTWALSNQGAGTFKVLAPFPKETIAGVPSASDGNSFNYGSANASLQTGSHNPIVSNSATFVFTVTGLPDGAVFDNIVLFLGTGPEQVNCTDCNPPGVPEPASMFLLGTGLLGAAASIRRRRRK